MARTRAFRSGNSQAIRIPADIAYADVSADLEISRHGDVLVIRPAREGFVEAMAELRLLPKPPSIERRDHVDLPERAGN